MTCSDWKPTTNLRSLFYGLVWWSVQTVSKYNFVWVDIYSDCANRTGGIGSEVVWNLLHEACICFLAPWHWPFFTAPQNQTHSSTAHLHLWPQDPSHPHNKSYYTHTHTHTHTHTGTTLHVCTSWNCACPHRHRDEHTAPSERSPPHLGDGWFKILLGCSVELICCRWSSGITL